MLFQGMIRVCVYIYYLVTIINDTFKTTWLYYMLFYSYQLKSGT